VVRLHIASTWDGEPLLEGEQVDLLLTGHDDHIELRVDAPFYGDPAPPAPPGTAPGLWNYEVVELFIAGQGERYLEVELGPHGHHLVLQLSGVRNVVQGGLELKLEVSRDSGRWTAQAVLPRVWLPSGPHRVNAYSIHGQGEGRRFLAMTPVPGEGPDFHRLGFFSEVLLP